MSGDTGAGSGGGIYIVGEEVKGSGVVRANGGDGGGGGGRVGVKQTKKFDNNLVVEVKGGGNGAPGRSYFNI